MSSIYSCDKLKMKFSVTEYVRNSAILLNVATLWNSWIYIHMLMWVYIYEFLEPHDPQCYNGKNSHGLTYRRRRKK